MENYLDQRRSRYLNFFLNVYALYNERVSFRKFVELLLTLGAIIVFSLFAIKPTSITIIGLVKEISEKEKTIVFLDKKIDNLRVGQSQYAQILTFAETFDDALAQQAPIDFFLALVNKYAAEKAVTISQAKIAKVALVGKPTTDLSANLLTLPTGLTAFSATLSVTGTYPNVLAFVSTINQIKIPIIIDKMTITKVPDNQVTASLKVRVPYLLLP